MMDGVYSLDPELLDQAIDVVGAEVGTLRDLTAVGPTLLVLLRHTG